MTSFTQLEKGRRYRALVPVALNRMVSVRAWEWRGESRQLPAGAEVTYIGTREFGSDPVPEDTFKTDDGLCWQATNVWGRTPAGLFEEASDGTH